jgi:hypothetical protein
MGGVADQTIPHQIQGVDLETSRLSEKMGRDSFIPQNQQEAALHAMLKNDNITIYHKVDDPIYDEFRSHVKERDEFNHHIKEIELNDRIKIWRTIRDVEKDTKERCAMIEEREKSKKKRMRKLMTCQCFRKKPISKEQKEQKWLKDRNNRILRQRKNADDNYMYMDQKPSQQGFQGELDPYPNTNFYSIGTVFTFAMFIGLFLAGAFYIINTL